MNKPAIREIRDQDIERVIEIWHASGVTRPWNDPRRDIAFARRDPHSTILVAALDESVVATVMVGHDGHRGWVYYVATDPAHQGNGLGRAMMTAAENWLLKHGVWKLNVLVRNDNTRVIGFYEHLGYRDAATVCLQRVLQP
jgi:ribosomal protein S18 acetylase RimI-like enzyme